MKFIYTFITALLLAMPLYSQQAQRMVTDFRGVATNGKTVVAYGDYGIITSTRDYGKTWSQTSIGDKYNIREIFTLGDNYIGVTDQLLFISTDNAATWQKGTKLFDTVQIIDVAISGDTLYMLTPTSVWTADANMQMLPQPLMQLDTALKYKEISSDGENVYVITDTILVRYSVASQISETVNMSATLQPKVHPKYLRYISNLKISDNVLYALLDDYNGFEFSQYLIRSIDQGKTWQHVSPDLYSDNTYKIEDGEVYFLRAHTGFQYIPKYYTIDSSRYAVDKTYFTIINDKDTLERRINTSPGKYTGLATINRDTMIAVGPNKLISVSYNGGKSWQLRSFFAYTWQTEIDNIHFIDEKRGYVIDRKTVFTTADGGITWLPQRVMNSSPTPITYGTGFHFANDGKGFVNYKTQYSSDTSIIMTNDYGDTYSMYGLNGFWRDNSSLLFQKGIAVGNTILFVAVSGSAPTSDHSDVLLYDNEFRFKNSVRIEANYIHGVNLAPDGNLYMLALKTSGWNAADSLGNSDTYSYSYFMLKSGDEGKTWDSIPINIQQELQYSDFNKTYRFYDKLFWTDGTLHGDYILYPAYSEPLLYRFNYKTSTFDSIPEPGKLIGDRNTIFSAGTTLYATSRNNEWIYYTDLKKFNTPNPVWDSLALPKMLSGWDNYDPSIPQGNPLNNYKDAVLAVQMLNDSTGVMLTGVANTAFIKDFKTNIVKFTLKTPTTDISETPVATEPANLWNSPPYPLPGKNIIASRIYWNNSFDIANSTITVYDISGMLLPEQKISIDKTQDHALLQWDCAGVTSGMYIIKVTLAGQVLSFPVVVAK
jgi:hypothetical protein